MVRVRGLIIWSLEKPTGVPIPTCTKVLSKLQGHRHSAAWRLHIGRPWSQIQGIVNNWNINQVWIPHPSQLCSVNANHPLQPVVGNPRSVSFSKEAQCSIQERLRRGQKRCDNWRIGYLGIAAMGKTVTLLQSRVDCPSASSPSADLETQNKKGAVSIHCEWPFFYRLMRRFIKGYRHKFSLQGIPSLMSNWEHRFPAFLESSVPGENLRLWVLLVMLQILLVHPSCLTRRNLQSFVSSHPENPWLSQT